MFVTSLAQQCLINGEEAAETLGYVTQNWLSYVCSPPPPPSPVNIPFESEAVADVRFFWLLLWWE